MPKQFLLFWHSIFIIELQEIDREGVCLFVNGANAVTVVNNDIVLICKGSSDGKNDLSALSGVWHYDQYTEYEFDGKGNGCMCLDNSNHYEFTYKAEDGTLYLDFALEYVTDCQYTYTIDGDKLTLVGGEGTAQVGKVYELTKVTE